MHPFEFALALVAMVMLFKLVRTLILRKNPARRDDTANAELLERLNEVEERVRVLEKIVTDERYDLRQQFKDLGA
jgi:predicted RNase H-like nuclease